MAFFDTTHATSTGVTNGEHTITIASAEIKSTRQNDGEYLSVKWRTETGATFYEIYNTVNKNPVATQIGIGNIGKFQVACGIPKGPCDDLKTLIGATCNAVLKNETDDYGDKVRVIKYLPKADLPATDNIGF
jgi:hypothetical protein